MSHVTNDMLHVTHETRHLTHDRWGEVNLFSKLQLPSSYGLHGIKGLLKIWRKRLTHLMSNGGLLNIVKTL